MKLVILISTFILLCTEALAKEVRFEGIRTEDEIGLKDAYPNLATNPTPSALDDAVRWLMLRDVYSKLEVTLIKNSTYLIKGKIQRRLTKVQISGIKNLDDIEAYNTIKLREGQRIDQQQILGSIQDLRELFGRSGYFNPEINASVKESQIGEVTLVYDIKENSPCRIDNIEIDTINSTLKAKLKSITKSKEKSIFSEKSVADLELELSRYLQENRFLNAKLIQVKAEYNNSKTKAKLIYKITDPYSFYLNFSGNNRFTRSDLLRAIDLSNFDRTSLNPGAEIADKIKKKYLSEGYAHVKIRFNTEENSKDYVKTINYTIEEGAKISIEKIQVVGRLSRPSEYYSEFIENNSSEAIDDHIYVKSDLELGYKNLITELNNQGLLRAKIQSARVEYNEKNGKAKIIVLLEEGPITTIKSIQFLGAKAFSESELISTLDLRTSQPLGLRNLELGLERLKSLYFENGFIEMSIENENDQLVTYDSSNSTADILLKIREGPQVIIREIIVEGNNITKPYVIIRGSDLDIGEILSPSKIEEAKQRLINMRIFSQVDIKTLEEKTSVSKRTVVINVSERSPGVFKIGAGVTNNRVITARGFTGISYDNLAGTGRAIGFNVTAETSLVYNNYPIEYDANISYLEPFLFDSKFRGRVSLGREEKVEDYSDDRAQIRLTNRLGFFTERDFTSKIKFTWNTWTLESTEVVQRPQEDPTFDPSKKQIATVGPILDIDYRDDPFVPTRGTYWKFESDYSTPDIGSSRGVEFVRTQGTFSFYTSFNNKKFVWANSLRGGYENNFSREPLTGIPESYAFFLGGYTTIRGFSGIDGDRIPNVEYLPQDQSKRIYIPNESSFYLAKSELRFPLYGIIGAAIFYDAGQVIVKGLPDPYDKTFSKNNPLRQAGGLGIRINTPVGPISIDYGRKFNHKSERSEDHLHVFIGAF